MHHFNALQTLTFVNAVFTKISWQVSSSAVPCTSNRLHWKHSLHLSKMKLKHIAFIRFVV